jgi:Tol biopolymer transport system component
VTRRRLLALAATAVVLLAVAGLVLLDRRPPLPADLGGTLVFVSNRHGPDALYVRRPPRDEPRRVAVTSEAVKDPALSPDGGRLAFAMGGRIGLVSLPRGEVRFATLGVEYRDAQPSWRPDGRGLVVSSRAAEAGAADLFLLDLETKEGEPARTALTHTRGLDETSPRFSPDGKHVVFVREDGVFRISLQDGRTQRLTAGFRRYREPRFLPSGRLLVLWSEGKRHGFEAMDADGKNRETLTDGTVFYRTFSPSPDGRYLAATFTFDLAFRPRDALSPRKTEEIHLLDAAGRLVAELERSVRHGSHSPEWGR